MALPPIEGLKPPQPGATMPPSARAAIALEVEMARFQSSLIRYLAAFQQNVATAVATLAFALEGNVKRRTPVDTGRLRASFHTVLQDGRPYRGGQRSTTKYSWPGNPQREGSGGEAEGALGETPEAPETGIVEAIVGSNVVYACVSSTTLVTTDKGPRRVGLVRDGDFVLTQDGTYRRVLASRSFPTVEKPDLVEVTTNWRSDRHRQPLVLTADHPILCLVGGVTKWVPSGDVRQGMTVWATRKQAHNKGSRQYPLVTCEVCSAPARNGGRRRRFCSNACRCEWLRGPGNPHIGRRRGEATLEKLRLHGMKSDINHLAAIARPSTTEVAVEQWLHESRLEYNRYAVIKEARAIADFSIPSLQLFVEADGGYWHRDQATDIERDKRILAARPGWQILHVHFYQAWRSPKRIAPNPIPGSHYVVCNPGIATLCNGTRFQPCEVLHIRHFRYEAPRRNDGRGVRPARLWDLSVEGMHSFVANGIVVANTAIEAGHSKQSPEGMVRVSVAEQRGALEVAVVRAHNNAVASAKRLER